MKCSDMRKCVYKTVEAFLDPMSSVFFWALWLSSMDISQTRFWGRSEVFALCLCFSNSKKRIIVFISYERLLNLPPRKTIFIGWVETAVVATIVEGIILSPANILIRRVIIDFLVELFSLCHLFSETSLRLTGMWFQKWETNNFCSFSQKLIVWMHTAELHGLSQVASQILSMEGSTMIQAPALLGIAHDSSSDVLWTGSSLLWHHPSPPK